MAASLIVGQVGHLRPIVNRPSPISRYTARQTTNLSYAMKESPESPQPLATALAIALLAGILVAWSPPLLERGPSPSPPFHS